jgi:magnesium-transporting ATPase (P-type)
MTHIFKDEKNTIIIACKGAPEAILRLSNLSISDQKQIEEQSLAFAKQGYRVLGRWEEYMERQALSAFAGRIRVSIFRADRFS